MMYMWGTLENYVKYHCGGIWYIDLESDLLKIVFEKVLKIA